MPNAYRPAYEVELRTTCPTCGESIGVSVYGASDVEITDGCSGACQKDRWYPWAQLTERAISLAQSERSDYERHLREYDDE